MLLEFKKRVEEQAAQLKVINHKSDLILSDVKSGNISL